VKHVVVMAGWAPSLLLFREPLLREMVARGHRVTAMAADGTSELRDRLASLGVSYEDVPLARAQLDPMQDLRTVTHLTRRLRVLRPDVMFAYTIKPVVYGLLAARVAGVARRYAMITGLGYAFQGQARLSRRVLRHTAALLYRGALAGADGLFVQNLDDESDLRAAGAIPHDLTITRVRGSGVQLDHYTAHPVPPTPLRFLFVGRLLREKGILDFVELARRFRANHPDARFEVAGWIDPNPESIDATMLARWTSEGVVEYRGVVDDVRPLLAAAHVLVLPSYREGTPRSVLEAMATGRAVIVTDVPGCRDTIVDGEHGYIVPVRDPDALTRAAERFVSQPELLVRMGARARSRVSELYDARAVAAGMLDVMRL
jgi:glycosyltransferase involved in cell wall biosynthesis